MSNHIFDFRKVLVGGSVECLLYAYITETPVIIDKPLRPFEHHVASSSFDFSFLFFKREERVGMLHLWERLTFLLSMGGLLLFPSSVESIKYRNKSITVVTQDMRKIEIRCDEIIMFDSGATNRAWIYDWFAVKSGGKHEIETLTDEDYLASQLMFFESQRIGVRNSKDVVAVTYLSLKDIYNMEYSEAYVAMKTRNMMKDAGIRGTSKGYDRQRVRKFSPIKIEHLNRDIKEHINPLMPIGEILEHEKNTEGKLWNLTQSLFRPQHLFI